MPPCTLEPINLADPTQHTELQRQRTLCGWDHQPTTLAQWHARQTEGLKNFFWIVIPSPNPNPDVQTNTIRAGHISLDAYSNPPDPDLARSDRSILALQTFFVLPEYRSAGVGRHAVKLIEEQAAREPACQLIALTALSKKYRYQEGREWRGIWERMGQPVPPFSIQEWYEKAGYVGWKEEPRYEERSLDGEVIWLWEVFMRKEVRRGAPLSGKV
ncbi:uncharacterized protein BO72DRAFT_448823 [Aspergillus fijiensis CBS 313.89]|uniref:N-acetyltransferase domain-containing protein n=1 Tax=Aspergillus fijiensis CBS 313.89 TaxID=1448319 RepID=A0A8G1RQP8_9EURO|nr:uncharacterized protein BO72DRAFT_448823 [Aspergillus fijiensis CBS 313.89]RAK76568.1 hypothetical protein BO72DRAFT_448823 [Aspergillus fijiensis CBS 313.89]